MALAIADYTYHDACQQLPDAQRSELGQYMTPSTIAHFMASLFHYPEQIRLLDAGAGTGSLTAAFLDNAIQHGLRTDVDTWEIDPILCRYLQTTLEHYSQLGQSNIATHLYATDFIEGASLNTQIGIGKRYTHAILNPPYKKIGTQSRHRQLLRKVGIETVNLYTSFMALAILLLETGGELVAIVPRSFCNGSYYRPFRELLLKHCAICHIHLFESRRKAFAKDGVLQENIIIHLKKGVEQGKVKVSSSHDAYFVDYQEVYFDFSAIVKAGDVEQFIHIPTNHQVTEIPLICSHSLSAIGLEVCTGAVVDFRLKECWSLFSAVDTVPLLYPHHFRTGQLDWPTSYKQKPNALHVTPLSQKWLMPNEHYVLVKRFSAKEERRRIVAYHFKPELLASDHIGFENHWNVFHVNKSGLDATMAAGLTVFLNSTLLDTWFRVFSGHTQVNATDLRNLRYPSKAQLIELGKRVSSAASLEQGTIDQFVSDCSFVSAFPE